MGEEPKPDDDFVLLAAFNSGSADAFARLVERHSAALIGFLYCYTRDRASAEDLAQEAFLRLYRAAPDLKPEARLSTILYKFAYHLAVDLARAAAQPGLLRRDRRSTAGATLLRAGRYLRGRTAGPPHRTGPFRIA